MVVRLAHQVVALLAAQVVAHLIMVVVAVEEILPLVEMELQLWVVLAVRELQTASLVQASPIRAAVEAAHTMLVLAVLVGQGAVVRVVLERTQVQRVLLARQT